MINNEFFFEIMCEKIPVVEGVNATFRNCVVTKMNEYSNVNDAKIETWVSAHRLVCKISNFPSFLQKKVREIKGPKTNLGEEVLSRFAMKHGCDPNHLMNHIMKRQINHEEFYFIKLEEPSMPMQLEVGSLINDIIKTMTWPEYMKWDCNIRWIRPIRRIVAISDESPIMFSCPDCNLSSSPSSLYSITDDEEFIFNSSEHYFTILGGRNIFVKSSDRKQYLQNQIKQVLSHTNLRLLEDSQNMIDNILGCTESPKIYISEYEDEFDLPDQIRKVVMMYHLKYIPLFNQDRTLSKSFLLCANYELEDEGALVRMDASKAIFARFKEATYFWNKDLSMTEAEYANKLQKALVYTNLGSLNQQTHRFEFMVSKFFPNVPNLKEAAYFLNIDLCMDTIFEIPELHGVISGLYAILKCKSDKKLSKIISDSIFPKNEDSLPADMSTEGAYLGFCVRLDQIVGFFGKNHIPKGSSDPFALRRAAFGLVRLGIFIESMPCLDDMINHSIALYYNQGIILDPNTFSNVKDFLKKRLEVLLKQTSDKFGPLFVRENITWKENARLKFFLGNQESYESLTKLYKRLSGLCHSKMIVRMDDTLDIKEHKLICDLLMQKPSKVEDELKYLLDLSDLIEDMLNKVRIQDLDQAGQNLVFNTLLSSKELFDNYCNLAI